MANSRGGTMEPEIPKIPKIPGQILFPFLQKCSTHRQKCMALAACLEKQLAGDLGDLGDED
jgi:hypothetical protein